MEITWQRCMGLSNEGLVQINERLSCLPRAYQALCELQAHAKHHGFELMPCSAFRSFESQAAIFSAKFLGQRTILDINEQPLKVTPTDPIERIKAILLFSAMPGFSRHHFGSDLDIYAPNKLPAGQQLELTYHEYAQGSYFYEFGCYLKENLSTFGFINPYLHKDNRNHQGSIVQVGMEPWHISHVESAQDFVSTFDYEQALDYLAATDLPFAPYVKAVMSYEQANAMLCLTLKIRRNHEIKNVTYLD